MTVLVTGGTGFIGNRLCQRLVESGHAVTVLTRGAKPRAVQGVSFVQSLDQVDTDANINAIVNLAGEPLSAGRWNAARKQAFTESRVATTRAVVQLIERLERPPETLLSGSAIGWYGPNDSRALHESSSPVGCFSHELCATWEQEALAARPMGVRVCLLRIGVVLGREGGALGELARSHRFGVESVLGDGEQYISWIHIEDMVSVLAHLLTHDALDGPVNCTAPNPATQRGLSAAIAQRLRTFIKLKMPGSIMRAMLGEMADEMVLTGQKVVPQKLLSAGFQFRYPELQGALEDLLP